MRHPTPIAIEAWRRKWPHCDFGWALPADIVVVDIDVKRGKNGFKDFSASPASTRAISLTPSASTPSGGLQLFYRATKAYKNAVAIGGTGIDTRTEGGYVVLPGPGNGRQWLRALIGADGAMAPLLPAPAWLDFALKRAPSTRAPLTLAPRAALIAASSDSGRRRKLRQQLERACAKIVAAPCGAQDATRHAQCFYIGGIIAQAAAAISTTQRPTRPFSRRRRPCPPIAIRGAISKPASPARSRAGMAAPLALSETEQWVRNFRARMRLKRDGRAPWLTTISPPPRLLRPVRPIPRTQTPLRAQKTQKTQMPGQRRRARGVSTGIRSPLRRRRTPARRSRPTSCASSLAQARKPRPVRDRCAAG